ncbi:MAG: GNAT family N-acetyltransferase [Crocinitomicaceae bacterium]|nr:GNAT family N-acetyltransferase [Crocinitomicaceae bacterium]
MKIRNAAEKDLQAILDIFNYEIVNTEYVYIYEPWNLEYALGWFQEIQQNNFPFLVIEDDNEIMGYAYYSKFREREAYDTTVEYSVYIHRYHRKKGLARKLVLELIERAKEQGYHVMVGGLDASNVASYNFHKRLGFTEAAHFKSIARKNGKWLDLIFFQLMLSE